MFAVIFFFCFSFAKFKTKALVASNASLQMANFRIDFFFFFSLSLYLELSYNIASSLLMKLTSYIKISLRCGLKRIYFYTFLLKLLKMLHLYELRLFARIKSSIIYSLLFFAYFN